MFDALTIPCNASWFYVSDSYTIDLNGVLHDANDGSFKLVHDPGPANQSPTFPAGKDLTVFLKSASMELVMYTDPPGQGVNVDVQIAIYDVTNLVNGRAVVKAVLPFRAPYGTAANGQVINHVCSPKLSPSSVRDFGVYAPLKLGIVLPQGPVPNTQYQVGARIQFNFGVNNVIKAAYQYHLHGAITAI